MPVPSNSSSSVANQRMKGIIRAKKVDKIEVHDRKVEGRRAALLGLAGALFTAAASMANTGVFDEYLEKSKANKELNDKKRLATSGANFARAYTRFSLIDGD